MSEVVVIRHPVAVLATACTGEQCLLIRDMVDGLLALRAVLTL